MNDKDPIENETPIINKEEKKNNENLQYLIDRNKIEKIDFITTLLKLKGIKTNEVDDNNDNTYFNYDKKLNKIINNNNKWITSNDSTTVSKKNSENKINIDFTFNNNNLINNNTLNNEIINTTFNIKNNQGIIFDVKNINKNNINTINNSKKLTRFCSCMLKKRKKSKIYSKFNSSKKNNNEKINISLFKENNHNLIIFNNIKILNNKPIDKNGENIHKNKEDKKEFKPQKFSFIDKNYKSDLFRNIPKYKKDETSHHYFKNKVNEIIVSNDFSDFKNTPNSSLIKKKPDSIIKKYKSNNKKNINAFKVSFNNIVQKRNNNIKCISQPKNLKKNNSNCKFIKKCKNNFFNRKNNIINLKLNKIKIKDKFYNQQNLTSKSNMVYSQANSGTSDTFRLNIKKLKRIINDKKDESKHQSKKFINKNLFNSIINKNEKKYEKIYNKNNYKFCQRNIFYQKLNDKSKDFKLNDKIDGESFLRKDSKNNIKKSIILDIKINKRCFSSKVRNTYNKI
jgi:hypothetical protein